MRVLLAIFLTLAATVSCEISEECRFAFPPRGPAHRPPSGDEIPLKFAPICCELPDVVPFGPEELVKCHDMMHGPPPSGGSKKAREHFQSLGKLVKRADDRQDGSPVPPPPFSQERKECMLNCLFNASGFLTAENMLNEEVLNQKLLEEVANNTKWAPTIDPVFKKCVAAAKEANSQSQKACKPGAAEYMKCMLRELFFNCPNEVWINSSECNEFKNKLEKCPNLHPPPHPRPPHPRKANREH